MDPLLWPTAIFTGDQIADFVANSIQASEIACQTINNSIVFRYYGQIDAENISIDAGRDTNPKAIPVPMAYLPKKDDSGVYYYSLSSIPACAPLPLDPQPPTVVTPVTGHVHVCKEDPTNPGWWSAGSDDGVPNGQTVTATSDDGVSGAFHKYFYGFGNGVYFLISRTT